VAVLLNAPQAAHGVSGSDLPRRQSWRAPEGYFQGRSGPESGEEKAGRIVREELRRGGGMERRGIGADAQRGPGGSEAGATVAPGNDDEFEVDSAASADGQLDLRFQPVA